METVTSQNPRLLTHQALKSNCSKSTRNSNINFRMPLKIYHQNIRGMRCKTNELVSHFHPTPPPTDIMPNVTSRLLGGTATNSSKRL